MPSLSCRLDPNRQRSLLLLQAPERWTTWPFLPVLRPRPDGSLQLGVVYDARGTSGTLGFSATVFLQNLFTLPANEARLLAGPKCVYDSLDELLENHWRVD